MKNAMLTLIITTLLLIGFTTETSAQRGFGSKRANLHEQLNLNEAQQDQMSDLRYEHQKQVLDLRSAVQKNKLEIKHMMAQNKVDANQLKVLTQKNSDLRSEMSQLKVDHWLKVYNLLDENQQEVWTKTFDKMGRRNNGRGGRSGRQGMGMGMEMNKRDGNRGFGNRSFQKGF